MNDEGCDLNITTKAQRAQSYTKNNITFVKALCSSCLCGEFFKV